MLETTCICTANHKIWLRDQEFISNPYQIAFPGHQKGARMATIGRQSGPIRRNGRWQEKCCPHLVTKSLPVPVPRINGPLEDMGLTWVWFSEIDPMRGGPHHFYHNARREFREWTRPPCRPEGAPDYRYLVHGTFLLPNTSRSNITGSYFNYPFF